MNKFLLLLKKETSELLTPQMILPFIMIMLVFVLIGNFAGKQLEKQTAVKSKIIVLDQDQSSLSKSAVSVVEQIATVETSSAPDESALVSEMNKRGVSVALTIPSGFGSSVTKTGQARLKSYALVNNFSVLASKNYAVLDTATAAINQLASDSIIRSSLPGATPATLKNPITTESFVSSKNIVVAGNASAVLNYVTQQTTFVPAILMIVIIFAAQMIATAVATEKENKTLETLLSLPVSRRAIVTAKMLSAGFVAIIMAAIYMYGIRGFSNGLNSVATPNSANVSQIAQTLGLKFTAIGYLELGGVLFLGILLALAIAMILGAFSEDAKSAQSVIAPLMILVLIPYFITLLLDTNQLSTVVRYIIYIIPFSHLFLAAPNILLGNHAFILYGAIYLFVLFIVFVLIAARIFSSDLILTMKLNFSKKKS